MKIQLVRIFNKNGFRKDKKKYFFDVAKKVWKI